MGWKGYNRICRKFKFKILIFSPYIFVREIIYSTIHKSINIDNSSRGLIGNVDKVLTSGEYVIIDTDHIYFEKDIKDYNKIFTSALAKRFEMRYRKEKDSELIEQDAIIEEEYHKTR